MSKRKEGTAEKIAERLLRQPFEPFVLVDDADGRHTISHPWQAVVTPTVAFVGSPTKIDGVVENVATLEHSRIVELVDLAPKAPPAAKPAAAVAAKPGETRLVELFTDGACLGNPGKGGWAFILRDPAQPEEIKESGADRHTTNNRMELTSVIEGLERIAPPAKVVVVTDSQYVSKGVNEWMAGWKRKGWKRSANGKLEPVANVELWQRLDELCGRLSVACKWVRGHVGHPENEECDRMAVAAYRDL